MSKDKMKSLLKGLRCISQMFENGKEQEMQIGNPTNVKHIAHIGWDGGSPDSPTWMNGFKNPNGDIKDDASYASNDSSRSREMGGQPRASRNRAAHMGSSAKEKSRLRPSNPDATSKSSRKFKESSEIPPNGSRKCRRRRSKDSAVKASGNPRRARDFQTEAAAHDSMSETGSMISITSEP